MSNENGNNKVQSIIPVFVPEPITKFGCEVTYDEKTYIGVLDHWAAVHGENYHMQVVTESFLISQLNQALERRYLIALKSQITEAIRDRHAALQQAEEQGMTKSSIITKG